MHRTTTPVLTRSLLAFYLATCLAHAAPHPGQETPATPPHAEEFDGLRAKLRERAVSQDCPAWIALVRRGERTEFFESFWNEEFWSSERLIVIPEGREIEPYQVDHIFRIGSLTMPITCAAALILIEEGRLALTDPLSKYLPEYGYLEVCEFDAEGEIIGTRLARSEIRIVDLLAHTSGLSSAVYEVGVPGLRWRYEVAEEEWIGKSLRERTRLLAGLPLAFDPGTGWAFGRSTDVLGVVLEVIEERTLQEILSERLLTPLGMEDTGFVVPPEKDGRIAPLIGSSTLGTAATITYFAFTPEGLPRKDPPSPPTFCSGGSGLYSTASDFARFCEMLAGGGQRDGVRILSEESVRLMTTDHLAGLPRADFPSERGFGSKSGFGLGLAVRTADGTVPSDCPSVAYHWSSGGSCFFIDPERRLIGVLLGMGSTPTTFRRGVYAALRAD